MKYFVTSLSPFRNIGTYNWQTMILDDYTADDNYWKKAELDLSQDTEWVTQSQLYKRVKRNDGVGNEIILSKPVSVIFETIKSDFPNAVVSIYH